MVEVNNVESFELEDLYQLVNNNENFASGVNLEIYEIINNEYVKARVYERGVEKTDERETSAIWIFKYISKTNKIATNGYILYPGGELNLRFENEELYLSGEVIYL